MQAVTGNPPSEEGRFQFPPNPLEGQDPRYRVLEEFRYETLDCVALERWIYRQHELAYKTDKEKSVLMLECYWKVVQGFEALRPSHEKLIRLMREQTGEFDEDAIFAELAKELGFRLDGYIAWRKAKRNPPQRGGFRGGM